MSTNLDATDKRSETAEQRETRQVAALCRFAACVEKIAKDSIRPDVAMIEIREQVHRLNVEMDWEQLP